jgi:eukaryotic-like serine/threonine-protein kinase
VVGEKFADRYELTELVGTGGMSSVYKAHDTLLERNVALKMLHDHYSDDEEFVERFKREARTVAQLSHPNIVTVIDRGEAGGRQFIVFEYIDGENLKELLVRSGRLPVERALELALEIAHGLAFAHQHGLIHRDVKPQNVLLNGDGAAKVTDFGIARSLDVEHGVTQTGTVLGTSNYIAPEQASGQPVDAHTDVYSLGVVLYELLAGDVPFPGENFVSVAMKHVNEPPPNLLDVRRDVPLRVAAAVDRALEKDPRQRFPSMDAFAAELEVCLAELQQGDAAGEATMIVPRAAASRAAPRPRRRWARWPLLVGLLAVLAIAAIAVGFLALRGHGTKKPKPVPATAPLRLVGAGSYDPPPGDGNEHGDKANLAVDGDFKTYWYTETYTDFAATGKKGVGLVLSPRRTAASITRITIRTDTPGFSAELLTGRTAGRYHAISSAQDVQDGTTFSVPEGSVERYLVVWLTSLPIGYAHVNEVRAA